VAAVGPEALKVLLGQSAQLGLTEQLEQLEQLERLEQLELPEQQGRHCLELTLALTDLQETALTGLATRLRLTT
jgi:DNA-binding HxlR family transcriptional regulator